MSGSDPLGADRLDGDSGAAAPVHLERLVAGQQFVYDGNKLTAVSADLAAAFAPGDRLLIDPSSGELLHIPAAVGQIADAAVANARRAFGLLAECSNDQVSAFFESFADRLADDGGFTPIAEANALDVADARRRGRSVTRLVLDPPMRAAMIDGLRGWARFETERDLVVDSWTYPAWSVSARRAPLGVVGFVFEGRPNVFADAAGVLRTGNTAVFRIGSDALTTAEAIMEHAVRPAIAASGLPDGAIELVRTPERAAGWAMFTNSNVALAVARGSGPAVAQLGAVARQSGIAVSLHGTGGAWLIVDPTVAPDRVRDVVATSLDRKVCNTLNTVVLLAGCDDEVITAIVDGLADAASASDTGGGEQRSADTAAGRVHLTAAARRRFEPVLAELLGRTVEVDRAEGRVSERFASEIADDRLGVEWEWEATPEITVACAETIDEAIEAFNQQSPRFVVSVLTGHRPTFERAYSLLDAPFVGDGMTRWVDGQYALQTPELGLSNWQEGRALGRGGILSGDGIFTVRYLARIPGSLRR